MWSAYGRQIAFKDVIQLHHPWLTSYVELHVHGANVFVLPVECCGRTYPVGLGLNMVCFTCLKTPVFDQNAETVVDALRTIVAANVDPLRAELWIVDAAYMFDYIVQRHSRWDREVNAASSSSYNEPPVSEWIAEWALDKDVAV